MFGAISLNQTTVAPAFRQQGDGAYHLQKQHNRCEFIQDGTLKYQRYCMKHLVGISDALKQNCRYLRDWLVTLTMFTNSQERDGHGRFPQTIFRPLFNQYQTSSLWTHIDSWLNLSEYHMHRYPNSEIVYSSTFFPDSPKWSQMHIRHHIHLTSLFSSRL